MLKKNLLKDTLFLCSDEIVGNDPVKRQYAKGAVVGLVSGLMAIGYTYARCIELVAENMPRNFFLSALPDPWVDDIANLVIQYRSESKDEQRNK